MTNSINIRSIAAISAFAGLSAMALVAQTGTASAKSVLSCDGTSRQSVIECCQTLVHKKGMPYWMVREGRNCQTAKVVCISGEYASTVAGPRLCKYQVVEILREKKGKSGGRGREQTGRY